jgi:MraZ protein
MALFLGTHIFRVDRKGRVSVPAQFRNALADQHFPGIILFPSPLHDGVVEGCSMAYLEIVAAASQRQLDVFSDESDDLANALYGRSVQLPWDSEGRVVLPESILSHAGIGDMAVFLGMGGRFHLLEPGTHAARGREADKRLRQNRPKLLLSTVERP